MNGDIILKKISFSKLNISLRAFISVTISLLCAAILIFYAFISSRMYRDRYEDELKHDMKLQCEILSYNILENGLDILDSDDIHLAAETMANFFRGRVMIIDKDYRIVIDSFGDRQGSYIINDEVIRVMVSDGSELLSIKDGYIQYIYSIVSDGEVLGVILLNASTELVDQLSDVNTRRNITVVTAIILVAIVAACLIGFFSVRGVKRINRQIENTRSGHLDEQIPAQGFKEFRTLTSSYNKTIEKLMVIDSTRQEFVSNVSHELKTPITSMKVLADSLVQNEQADLNMYKEFMTDIIEEIDRESQIINDLLTLVKTDRKDAEMNIAEVDINDLLEVILKRVTPIATSRGIEITYESYRDVVADVDEVKLSLALTNIIENAVKYNIDNGWVKVTLNADHKNFHIKVADSGVGIPDDCKEQVFERFYRVDKARSRDTGGTGLGLAITRNVIRMHKGTIKLYSESGEGTTFTIKIPMKRVEG